MCKKFQTLIPKFLSARNVSSGFTLIELLVVIGILGILAAALIATIDPFEQLRKANDTTARTTSTEFLNAATRYYGSRSAYPWSTTAEGGEACASYPATPTALSGFSACVTPLVNQGELKSSFTNASNVLKNIYVIQANLDTPLQVCYLPTSKSGQKDVNAIYNANGVQQSSGCKSQGGTTSCWSCTQ